MPPRKKAKTGLPARMETAANMQKLLTKAELVGLQDHMFAKFQYKHITHQYQIDGIEAQLQMWDVLVHAGMGMGKTTIAAGPHAHPTSTGKVMLMISPLIALHDEQVSCSINGCIQIKSDRNLKVETFRDEFNLKATAVNRSNGGCKIEVLQVCAHEFCSSSAEEI
jgi:hypothetical protein